MQAQAARGWPAVPVLALLLVGLALPAGLSCRHAPPEHRLAIVNGPESGAPILPPPVKPLPLDEVLLRAREGSGDILAARLILLRNDLTEAEATSRFYPRLSLETGLDVPINSSSEVIWQDQTYANLTMQWDFIRFWQISQQIDLAKLDHEAASLQYQLEKKKAMTTALEASLRLGLAHQTEAQLLDRVESARQEVQAAAKVQAQGLATAATVAKASEALTALEQELAATRERQQSDYLSLCQFLRLPVGSEFLPPHRCALPPPVPSLPSALQAARGRAESIRIADLRMAAAARGISLAALDRWTQFGSYVRTGSSLLARSYDLSQPRMSAGVSWTLPLLDQGTSQRQVRQARLEHESSILSREAAGGQLERDVRELWLDIRNRQQALELARRTLSDQQREFEQATAQQAQGLRSRQELAEARQALAKARLDESTRFFDLVLVRVRFDWLIGLNPEEWLYKEES